MKFRVERDVLGQAVSWVARALPARPVVPVLAGLLLQADSGELRLSCFDYEVSARAAVQADVGEPGTALVPGTLLAEIARNLPSADVEVTTTAGMVTLTCGSAEFALVSLPLADYPDLPAVPSVAGTVDGGLLATGAAQVVPSASRDDTLPMLTGVCLDVDGPVLTLAATDRYRMAVRTVRWDPAEPAARFSVLVPARTLAEVARTMAPGKPVTIAVGQPERDGVRVADGVICFEGAGRRLTARLIGAEFIRYESRFPAAFDASAELPAGPFTEAVRRVSLVADRGAAVQLAFRQDAVVIEAQSDGRARAVETVPARLAGDDQVISFNPHYLLDGLTAVALTGHGAQADGQPAGRIRLQFTSPARPALITWLPGDPAAQPESSGAPTAAGDAAVPGVAAPPAGGDADDQADRPAFRYLMVPLRVLAAG
ncbi:MAG: DNA polymerase III subunit beta [Streptosporangiaceae bacterium]